MRKIFLFLFGLVLGSTTVHATVLPGPITCGLSREATLDIEGSVVDLRITRREGQIEEAFKDAKKVAFKAAFGINEGFSNRLDDHFAGQNFVCAGCPKTFTGCTKTWSVVSAGTPTVEPKDAEEACEQMDAFTVLCTLKIKFVGAKVKAQCSGCAFIAPLRIIQDFQQEESQTPLECQVEEGERQ